MVNKKSWEEFKQCGLLWFINTILHTFGWAICYEIKDDKIVDVFQQESNLEDFQKKQFKKVILDYLII